MDQEDYNTKIKALLDDKNTYKPVAKDRTSALERSMNSTLFDLRRKGRPSLGLGLRLKLGLGLG